MLTISTVMESIKVGATRRINTQRAERAGGAYVAILAMYASVRTFTLNLDGLLRRAKHLDCTL